MLYSGSEGLLLPLAMKHPPSPQNDLFSSLCNLSGERVTGPHFFSFPESIDYLFILYFILFFFASFELCVLLPSGWLHIFRPRVSPGTSSSFPTQLLLTSPVKIPVCSVTGEG